MADSVKDRAGQQLGNYRLLRMLRQESSADVYLGEHIFLKTQATIKALPEQLSTGALEAFLAETRRIARMKHPHILRILEFGVEGKMPFLVTDYTPNDSLRLRHPSGTLVSAATIASYVPQIASALHYIHEQGLIHGRVRPENMLPGPQQRLLLGDFSPTIDALSELAMQHTLPVAAEKIDELKYMAPEQLLGQICAASDQYALAVVIYEWLSGDTPFQGSASEIREQHATTLPALRTKIPTIPPELDQIVMTALAHDPHQRFASISAFARALEQLLPPAQALSDPPRSDSPHVLRSELPTEALPTLTNRHPQRRATKYIGISLILVVLLVIGGSLIYNTKQKAIPLINAPAATQTAVTSSIQQRAEATFAAQGPDAIYTHATSGTPIINDPLNNKSTSTWKSNSSCTFSNGAYHVQAKSGKFFLACLTQKSSFVNFAYEVQMNIVKGSFGGVVLRSDSSYSNFYAFIVHKNGNDTFYTLTLYKNNNPTDLQISVLSGKLQLSSTITAIFYIHTFYLYINKAIQMTVKDSTLETGAIGMYTFSDPNTASDVAFHDAKVWQL